MQKFVTKLVDSVAHSAAVWSRRRGGTWRRGGATAIKKSCKTVLWSFQGTHWKASQLSARHPHIQVEPAIAPETGTAGAVLTVDCSDYVLGLDLLADSHAARAANICLRFVSI